MFRGTLKPETVLASIELVDAMCTYAMTHTTPDVQTCTFDDILTVKNYTALPAYAAERLAKVTRAAAD